MRVGEVVEALEQFDQEAEAYICFRHPWLAMRAEAARRMNIRHFHEEGEDFQVVIDTVPDRK